MHGKVNEGVGDDGCSWGVDGGRCLRWFGSGSSDWGEVWAESDVLGFAADLDARKLLFGKNGHWSVAFEEIGLPLLAGISPALTGQRATIRANFGNREWRYGPPDDSYEVYPSSSESAVAAAYPVGQ